MTNPYIILANSTNSLNKRFKVIKMSTPHKRTDKFELTAGGKWDKAAGVIISMFYYTLKVPAETNDANYGVLDDLETLFMLNNPGGSPSDQLTLTDHYGDQHLVKFNEDMAPEPVTTQLEGPNAIHYVNVSLLKIGEVGS